MQWRAKILDFDCQNQTWPLVKYSLLSNQKKNHSTLLSIDKKKFQKRKSAPLESKILTENNLA